MTSSLEKLGFSSRVTNKVIGDLVNARICFARTHQELSSESVLVPTRLCGYIVRDLVARLVLIEAVIFDTFIYGDDVWDEIRKAMKEIYSEARTVPRFRKRKAVARIFFDWVEREVQKLCVEAAKRNLSPFWTTNPIARIKPAFAQELDRALRSAVRHYGSAREQIDLNPPLFHGQSLQGGSSNS